MWHWHVLYLYVRIPVVMLLFVVVGGGWVAVYLAGLLSESQGPICEEPVCLCSCGDDRGMMIRTSHSAVLVGSLPWFLVLECHSMFY